MNLRLGSIALLSEYYRALGMVAGCFSATSFLIGCVDPYGPATAEIDGRVLRDGKPVPNADVIFTPNEGTSSEAQTDSEGYFSLSDVVVGRHQVRITANSPMTGDWHAELRYDVRDDDDELILDARPSADSFSGRFTHTGKVVSFDSGSKLCLHLFNRKTGDSFGVPIRDDGTFAVGSVPLGEYQAVICRINSSAHTRFPGAPGTYSIADGVTIRPDETEYEIELGEDWNPDALSEASPHARSLPGEELPSSRSDLTSDVSLERG